MTAANWHVVVVQFVADALFKTLIAVPVVGGVFLVVLLIGGDPSDLLALPLSEILPTMTSVLLAQPFALAAFVVAVLLVLVGGSLLMFVIKGGTVSVLVAAERGAGAIEHPPLRLPAFRRATWFSLERFTSGSERLFPRYLRLGVWLMLIYGVSTAASLALVFRPGEYAYWQIVAAVASAVLVGSITIANFIYLLFQVVMAADDCQLAEAPPRVWRLLRSRFPTVAAIFIATLGLVVLTTAASIVATAALGLIAFVPLVGLAALPLQLIAWLVRGVVFQYIGLTALVAYARVYRGMREGSLTPAAPVDFTAESARARRASH